MSLSERYQVKAAVASRSHAFEKAWYNASCSREMFDYVIRSKRVGVRAESLSMFSREKAWLREAKAAGGV